MPHSPLRFDAHERIPLRRNPELGEHTMPVLRELLGMSDGELARLDAECAFGKHAGDRAGG